METVERPVYETHISQHEQEISEFVELIRQQGVTSYLEIGSRYGGSLWRIGTSLPKGSRIVAVDLPHGDGNKFQSTQVVLEECVGALRELGYDAHVIIGDSTSPVVIKKARYWGPYDLCFIDALHTERNVRSDWSSYGPMARMVAFHDIAYVHNPNKQPKHFPIEVPKVWNEIKQNFRYVEIKHDRTFNGIGMLWLEE